PDIGSDEIDAAVSVLRSGWPTQGRVTEEFEQHLSKILSSNTVVVNNGSSALLCALLAHGLKPGDNVIVPAFTFIATSSVPKLLGAKVFVADCDRSTLNIDLDSVERLLKAKKGKVKFIISVDVAGLSCDTDAILELADRYGCTLIEDAAESFGAEYKNKP